MSDFNVKIYFELSPFSPKNIASKYHIEVLYNGPLFKSIGKISIQIFLYFLPSVAFSDINLHYNVVV